MNSDDSTKKRILEAAYRLFVKNGYQGSSMRDIAEEAGIKASSIYNHFSRKEDIFEAVFIEKHPLFHILDTLEKVKGKTAEELLTNAINLLHRDLHSEPALLNLFFVELVEMNAMHIQAAIETNFPVDSKFMKQVFSMKSELRNIREPVLIRSLIGTVFATIIFNWFIGESNSKRWGSTAEITDVILRGILKN